MQGLRLLHRMLRLQIGKIQDAAIDAVCEQIGSVPHEKCIPRVCNKSQLHKDRRHGRFFQNIKPWAHLHAAISEACAGGKPLQDILAQTERGGSARIGKSFAARSGRIFGCVRV